MNAPGGRYTRTAAVLHALAALLIVTLLVLGTWMAALPTSPLKLRLINGHKWVGVTFLGLTLLRCAWRLTHRPPPALPMPRWQHHAAQSMHAALYLLFLVVPLLGWAYSSAAGFPLVWLGVLPLPDFVPVDRGLADALKPWHGRAAWLLATLSALHVVAALKHHVVDHDGLLARMAPWRP